MITDETRFKRPKGEPYKLPAYKASVYAKCKACIFDPEHGGGHWRQQVEACTSNNCELYGVRPKSKGKRDD